MDHHPKPECGQAASVIRLWGYGPARVTAGRIRQNGSWRYIYPTECTSVIRVINVKSIDNNPRSYNEHPN